MKKLLVFAAVAAMGIGAYAGCGEDAPAAEGQVYQWKMLLKTTQGYSATAAGPICGEGDATCTVFRVPDKIAIMGWSYLCLRACDMDGATYAFWDPTRRAALEETTMTYEFLNILADCKTAETAWQMTGTFNYDTVRTQTITLNGAGFGGYSADLSMYVGFSGFAAGKMTAPYDVRSKNHNCCVPSTVWNCEDTIGDITAMDEAADTAVYGKWAMRLNPQASLAYAKYGVPALRRHSPKYAKFGE